MMDDHPYLWIVVIFFVAAFVGCALIGLSFLRTYHRKKGHHTKDRYEIGETPPYECGFAPVQSAQTHAASGFRAHYYVIALLFILFDLEIVLLVPFALYCGSLTIIGFSSVLVFLTLLALGFIVEWKNGVLDWY